MRGEVTFARWDEAHVYSSSALAHDTCGIVPVLIVQSQHQELANSRIVLEVGAYTGEAPWIQ